MSSSIINCCIIGIFASGKTSLAASFVKNKQSITNETTIGASFIVNYTQTSGGQAIQLNIWDTAGQERYAMLLPMYSRNADVIIFTIDPLNPDSVTYIKKMAPAVVSDSVVAIHLVVTKMDTQYGEANAKEMVDSVKAFFREFLRSDDKILVDDYYTSAMTCYNVEQPFITNCGDIIRQKVEKSSHSIEITLKEPSPPNNDCATKCGVL
jgi:Ras-related protein Rab-5C